VKYFIRPAARDDIIRQFRYYLVTENAPDVAFRFLDAVDDSIEQLLPVPHIGAPRHFTNPALEGLRSWPVKDFEDIRIYYLLRPDLLRVVRVLHGRRDIQTILEHENEDDE
jgi:toxin ParE1/3/4